MNIFKLMFLLMLFPSIGTAQNVYSAIKFGTGIPIGGSSREDALAASAATARMAYGFLAPISCTIDEICINTSSKTGTLAATDGVIDIYSESAGVPNASLSSGTVATNTNGFNCSTQSQAVTAGVQYFFHVTNVNAVPATNNFSVRQGPENGVQGGGLGGMTSPPGFGASSLRSTDNGATWSGGAGQRNSSAWYRVHCSSGAYFGYAATGDDSPSNPVDAADRIYSAREVGNLFTTPADASLNVSCISFRSNKIGTPTGKIRYRLYAGTTLVATTVSGGSVGMNIANQALPLCFSSPQALTANTAYRVVIGEETQSDTSSNAYGPHRVDWDSNVNSLALKPFNGTIQKTVCASSCSGGSWTDTSTSFYFMDLYLTPGDEFATVGGGGGGGVIGTVTSLNGGMQ